MSNYSFKDYLELDVQLTPDTLEEVVKVHPELRPIYNYFGIVSTTNRKQYSYMNTILIDSEGNLFPRSALYMEKKKVIRGAKGKRTDEILRDFPSVDFRHLYDVGHEFRYLRSRLVKGEALDENEAATFKADLEYLREQPYDLLEWLDITSESEKRQSRRIEKRIGEMIAFQSKFANSSPLYFLTLTLSDSCIEEGRPRPFVRFKMKMFLAKYCGMLYICNLDYGKENGRPHYHALTTSLPCGAGRDRLTKEELKECNRVYDSIFKTKSGLHIEVFPFYCTDRDKVRVAQYINKLSSHAVKFTTDMNEEDKHQNIIYAPLFKDLEKIAGGVYALYEPGEYSYEQISD